MTAPGTSVIGALDLRREIEVLEGLVCISQDGNFFFFYDPDQIGERARRFPMATILTNDAYDTYSDLNREGVFRLNVGLDKSTFTQVLGAAWSKLKFDYHSLDVFMPHPDYAGWHFICVLNPRQTMPRVRELIARARDVAAARYRFKHSR